MEKKKIFLFVIIMILLILSIICGIYLKINYSNTNHNQEDNNEVNAKQNREDALKFKEEYESLNNTIRESDGIEYNSVTIPEDNPIVYVNIEEALEILKNGSGIMYIGANNCPWCRTSIPVMFEAAKNLNINTIYYLTLKDQKTSKDKLEELKSILWGDSNNSENNEGIQISIPYIAVIRDGLVLPKRRLSLKLNEGQTKYDELTEEQHEELYNIFYELFTQ